MTGFSRMSLVIIIKYYFGREMMSPIWKSKIQHILSPTIKQIKTSNRKQNSRGRAKGPI